jgi:hypothetical protein
MRSWNRQPDQHPSQPPVEDGAYHVPHRVVIDDFHGPREALIPRYVKVRGAGCWSSDWSSTSLRM